MSLALLDWRRRVARLYAEVRGEPDIAAAHEHWRRTRDQLLRTHPVSPIPEPQRASYPGAPVAPYVRAGGRLMYVRCRHARPS